MLNLLLKAMTHAADALSEANLPETSVQLPGYGWVAMLYQGSRTIVCRAIEEATQKTVVIKYLRDAYPSFGELVQFRNQYTITQNLSIPGIVRPLGLEPLGNGYALIMEDGGGISLADHAQPPLALTEVLGIALQLADVLHELLQQQVIHKDIKPANILIHPESKRVKLIDFSIASLLPKETQSVHSPKSLEGTLAYMAPEQTGRMNRAVDYRSDFYGLGVTLYELLTGQLPFISDDPLALIHCHVAQSPAAADQVNPQVPAMVAAIVAKLMAKNAEDRYQSALGLKHDLEQCLIQWKAQGEIAGFQLGQRDVSDRFLIPEKLYGRETEVQTLLDAFERVAQGASELMLVAGFSGIGKTVVINEVHKPIVRQRGYFIKGKFDQFNRNSPFLAFVQAFRDLVGQLLSESDAELQTWKAKILDALGDNAQVIIDLIPELENITGPQPAASSLSGTAAQNRFNFLFQRFIQVFTTPDHPLVIFVDDLQWADSASLNLIQVLMADTQTGHLLLLGAYRDNEVFPAHPLMLTLDGIGGAILHTLSLTPLSHSSLNHLIADTLHASDQAVQPLTELVIQKTQGNPFFATQFLNVLHQNQLIIFNADAGHWQCDITKVQDAALTDDVIELMTKRLQKLPPSTQNILKLAACIGAQFDLETIAITSEQSKENASSALWIALQEGLVLPINQVYKFFQTPETLEVKNAVNPRYRFLHDRVQQAAYALMPTQQQQVTHLKIGRLLLNNSTQKRQAEEQALNHLKNNNIFDIVNQMNLGLTLITSPDEKEKLAKLNFMAGERAMLETAYSAAFGYAKQAYRLLPENTWQQDYSFTLSLYLLAAETAYLAGDLVAAEDLKDIVLDHAGSALDKSAAYEVGIQILVAQNRLLEAIDVGLSYLSGLGIDLPENPDESDSEQAIKKLSEKLPINQIESLISLPSMVSKPHSVAMRILSNLLNAAYLGRPDLLSLIVAKQVELSMDYGNMEVSPSAYANYGLILCGISNEIEAGCHFGNLAIKLFDSIESRKFYAKTVEIVGLSVQHWQAPISSTLALLLNGYKTGLETGDFESAAFAAYDYCAHSFVVGKNLVSLEQEMRNYSAAISEFNQRMVFHLNELHRQTILNLMAATQTDEPHPVKLSGSAYDEDKMLSIHQQDNDFSSLALLHIDKLFLAYLFGHNRQAVEIAAQAESYLEGIPGQVFVPLFYFYDALSWLALYPELNEEDKQWVIVRSLSHQAKMKKWASYAPMNYAHKMYLLQAEHHHILDEKVDALRCYDQAIAAAKTNGYIQEEALANELAAKFYLDWGKEKVAAGYMQEAYYGYSRWGAEAKVSDLETRYRELLRPILQSSRSSGDMLTTLMTIASPATTVHSSTRHGTTINQTFDFASILRASQALSSTIQFDELLRQLTQIILQNSGVDRCALLLTDEAGEWQVRTQATAHETQLCSRPLTNHPDLPVTLLQYVKNTQKVVAIDDLETDLPVIDDYLTQHRPKSILGLPILHQSHLIGILYLQNSLTSGTFTQERRLILNFLCTQAAISLENARLYQKAQHYAEQLEQSQLQVVQNEKMATLGNLVAGVAHEVNNPIGFLNGSIENATDYLQDLFDHLETYQSQQPPNEIVQESAEEIDLEFLLEDLPKLLDSMKTAADRITGISTSLRTFSRADTEHKVSANLHEGINSTLLILKYRLKANEKRPAIEVIQDYDDLPEIDCFPGQLNQVFMNLLVNAIDMFDEMAQQTTFEALEQTPQKITIQTATLTEQNAVEIRISDNGKGMPNEIKSRIFDHLFTTKGVGKGTGLGLAIARQIVVESHSGTLEVHSEAGQGTTFCIRLPI